MASTEIVPAASRQISTPAGALALRQTLCSAAGKCIGVNDEQARGLITDALRELLPAALDEARALLAPALGADFKRTVSPSLALVAPAGMSAADQKAWLATAAKVLSGMPADLLEWGCTAAQRVVDHPAKIVPAIFKEVQSAWDRRRYDAARVARLIELADAPQPEEPSYISGEDARAILKEAGLAIDEDEKPRRQRHTGRPRHPGPTEIAEIARELSLTLEGRTDTPPRDISGLTVSEIFQQRDYAIGRDIERAHSEFPQ